MKHLVLGLALGFILGAAATALAGAWLDSREIGEDRDAGDRYALTLTGLSDKRRHHACVVAAEAFYGIACLNPIRGNGSTTETPKQTHRETNRPSTWNARTGRLAISHHEYLATPATEEPTGSDERCAWTRPVPLFQPISPTVPVGSPTA